MKDAGWWPRADALAAAIVRLERAGGGNVERLRASHAIGPAAIEGLGQVRQVPVVLQIAVAVDHHDQIPSSVAHADVPARARKPPRIGEHAHAAMSPGERRGEIPRAVARLAVHHEDLEPRGVVALRHQPLEDARASRPPRSARGPRR